MSRKRKVTHGNPAARVTLYHYTHELHRASIVTSGVLRTTESNLSFTKPHAGPDVVWLTTDPDLLGTKDHGLRWGRGESKAQIRITVSVPRREAQDWRTWARAHGSAESVMRILSETAGGDTSSWRVVDRPIPRAEWLAIEPKDPPEVHHG